MNQVTDHFIEMAHEAVEGWDGQDNAELIALIAAKFGVSQQELIKGWPEADEIPSDLIEDDYLEYEHDCPYCEGEGCHECDETGEIS